MMAAKAKPPASWRDHVRVHPAADLFPLMSKSDLRELADDIKKNGQKVQVLFWINASGKRLLIDGRNRIDAMALAGLPIFDENGSPEFKFRYVEGDPYEIVLSLNIHRRHLTAEDKRDLIAKVLKAKPEASNRKITKQVKTDHKTVAVVRNEMESTGEIPQLEKTTGADGKKRKKRKSPAKKKSKPKPVNDHRGDDGGHDHHHRVTGSAEVSAEQRRADMAGLDQPEETVDEVVRRVSCVANTIRGHVDGLTHSDARRFFATLKDMIDVVELAMLADAAEAASSEAA